MRLEQCIRPPIEVALQAASSLDIPPAALFRRERLLGSALTARKKVQKPTTIRAARALTTASPACVSMSSRDRLNQERSHCQHAQHRQVPQYFHKLPPRCIWAFFAPEMDLGPVQTQNSEIRLAVTGKPF